MPKFAGESNAEMASEFIVRMCQLMSRSSLVHSDFMHNILPCKSYDQKKYSILCGSHAEFYIRPLNTCIGDADILIADAGELAFSGDFPVLPNDVSGMADTIDCYKIEPYDRYPCFVRLRHWGEINYDWTFKEFNYTAYDMKNKHNLTVYVGLNRPDNCQTLSLKTITWQYSVTGPAVKQLSNEGRDIDFIGSDFVRSIWCPQWPKEAQGWLDRPRRPGWPTTDIISEVVQSGCHLVYVQHRSCRNDKLQWRFSFSLAEVILIQSWNKTQQLVYHLLRFFAKRELIQKDCPKEAEVLCTYHLKTLMLWTCERMPSEWWNSACVITICSGLLKKLSEWLKKKYCPNYFIPEANLIHDQSNDVTIKTTVKRLYEFHNFDIFCHWIVENYILYFMRRYFNLKIDMPHYSDIMLNLLEYWNLNHLNSLELYFHKTFAYTHDSCRALMKQGFVLGLRNCLNNVCTSRSFELKADSRLRNFPALPHVSCFTYYDNLLCILHTAYGLGCGEISLGGSLLVESLNAVSMQPKLIKSKYHNFPETGKTQNSLFQLLRAQGLMENLTGSNSCSEFQLLPLMAKQFIGKALRDDSTIFNGNIPVARAYLAALHFAESDFQQATRLCSAVLLEQIPKEDKESLNAGCLLFIDDVARIIGLCILHQSITENKLHYINKKLYLDLRLSPKVFAHYLSGLSYEGMSTNSVFYRDSHNSSFPMDAYLMALAKPKCISSVKSRVQFNDARQVVYCRPDSSSAKDASSVNSLIVKERVLDALMEYALENMRSFYNAICKNYGFVCNIGDCYHALHLYKCSQYDQVLNLCERILKVSDLQKNLKKFAFSNVLLLSPLDSFFDRDVQSLLGFHTLFYYLYPRNEDLWKIKLTGQYLFEHCFARDVYHTKLQTSVMLKHNYSIKRYYFLERHFIARYLKLRCCVDCNLPYSEALSEFAHQKTNLPFERIIRRYILRRVVRI